MQHTLRSLLLRGEQAGLVERLCRGRDVDGGVDGEKVVGLERHHVCLARHDWEVFHPGVVSQSERVPNNDIFVLHVVVSRDPRPDPLRLAVRLVGVLAARKQLLVLVLGHVDMVVPELCTLIHQPCA